ncbi:hypothetical protein Gotur_020025, partial [Gossypium turneri]
LGPASVLYPVLPSRFTLLFYPKSTVFCFFLLAFFSTLLVVFSLSFLPLFGVTTLYCKPFANAVSVLSEPMADQSLADQTPPSSGIQSLSVESQPPSSSSTPQMSLEEKFKIIRSVGEECIQEDELLNLLNHKPEPICYDGF